MLAESADAIDVMATVTSEPSIYCTSMPTQVTGNLLNRKVLFSEGRYYISVVRGKLLIVHKIDSLLGRSGKALLSQFASFFKKSVALSI